MTIIQTPTLEDYIELVKFILSMDIPWNNYDEVIHEEYWYTDKEKTCVIININGRMICPPRCIEDGYFDGPILSMSEFYNEFYNEKVKDFSCKHGLI